MNFRMILYLTGQIMRVLGVCLLLPLLVSLIYNEPASRNAFAGTALVLILLGTLVTLKKPKNRDVYTREGMAVTAFTWILVSLFGACPFFFSGEIPNFADAIFEIVSGFTTTGSTILTNIEGMSKSCLFWRSFSHWLGGMGVLVFMLAILPQNDTRTMHLVRAESPGPTVGKLVAKMSFSVRILYCIYIALTVLEIIFLLFGGMSFFEAINHAFATAGTGGFGVTNGSIADYNSAYIDIVITVFLGLFSLNFSLYYLLLIGKFSQFFKNEELRAFLGICAASTLFIAMSITNIYGSFWTALRYAAFQVFSMISTAGFATANYMDWPVLTQVILILLMFIGGCAGSTGGGLKVSRVVILFKMAVKEIKLALNPRAVVSVKMDGKALDKDVVRGVGAYFALYMFIMALSMLILALDGHDLGTTVSAVITCFNNVGPGVGEIDPSGNFSGFANWAKVLLSLDMLLGRLEIYPLLVLFTVRKK